MDSGIKGKRALVMSAGGGLGSAVAVSLARASYVTVSTVRVDGGLIASIWPFPLPTSHFPPTSTETL